MDLYAYAPNKFKHGCPNPGLVKYHPEQFLKAIGRYISTSLKMGYDVISI